MTEQSRPARPWTRLLTAALRVGAAVLLVVLLLRRTDIKQALDLIRVARPGSLAAGVMMMAIPMTIGAFRWWLLLRSQRMEMPFHFVLRVQVAGYALSTVLPTTVGGDLLRVGYATTGGNVATVLATVLTDRIVGVGGLFVICDIASLVLLARTGSLGLLALAGLASLVLVLAVLALAAEPVYRAFARTAARARFLHIGERLVQVADGVRRFRAQPGLLLQTLGLSVVLWLAQSFVWYLLGVSVSSSAPLLRYLVCVPLAALSAMIPISIGGLGVRESSFVALMSHFGTPPESALAVALLFLGVLVFYALIGVLLFVTLRRRTHFPAGSPVV